MQYDILCFSTTDWDEIWGSRQQVMQRLARGGSRVLFVERQVGPEHLLRDPEIWQRKRAAWRQPALRQHGENLWLWQPPLMLPGRYYSLTANRLGQSRLAARVKPVLAQLEFANPLLWVYPPHSAPLIGQFSESLSVYHCIERFAGGQGGRKRQVILTEEEALLREVDQVFVHAEGLKQLYAPLARRPIVVTPSAADVALFQSTSEVHPLVAALPRPRLGVAGTLDGRIDVPLLVALVSAHPEWQLVLVGKVRPGRVDLRPLLRYPNVHMLGQQRFSTLPQFLNGMDVLLIPYMVNDLTQYISPIKLYEYLAVGKPVVSSDLPEVRPLMPNVRVAGDPHAFIDAVQQALAEDSPEQQAQRRLIARDHTWDRRVDLIVETLEQALAEKEAAHAG